MISWAQCGSRCELLAPLHAQCARGREFPEPHLHAHEQVDKIATEATLESLPPNGCDLTGSPVVTSRSVSIYLGQKVHPWNLTSAPFSKQRKGYELNGSASH